MKGKHLGELEELALLTVGALKTEAYAVAIMDEIENETGRKINVSAVHAVLKRLEKKGMVTSGMGGATAERGGRRKRYFELTVYGRKAIQASMDFRQQLFRQIPGMTYNIV